MGPGKYEDDRNLGNVITANQIKPYLGNMGSYSSAKMSSWPILQSHLLFQKSQEAGGKGYESYDDVMMKSICQNLIPS